MTKLSDNLDALFDFLGNRDGVAVSRGVVVVEIGPDTMTDERGRLRISREAFHEPRAYEPRFEMLMKEGLPWINITCYGIHDGAFVVGVELPRKPIRRALRTSVNYSGPPAAAIHEGWDATESLAIE